LIAPADVATVADQVRTLRAVRECLAARHLRMLETVPTPQFAGPDDAPAAWAVRYDDDIVTRAARPGTPGSPGAPVALVKLSDFLPFRRRRR